MQARLLAGMPDAAMRDELTLRQLLAVCDRGIENLEKAAGGTERPVYRDLQDVRARIAVELDALGESPDEPT